MCKILYTLSSETLILPRRPCTSLSYQKSCVAQTFDLTRSTLVPTWAK